MSKTGHIFHVEHEPTTEPLKPFDKTEIDNLESSKALSLMQSRLLLTNPRDEKTESVDIEEVETYPEVGSRYRKAFDSKDRKPNSLFMPNCRGTRLVTVVVDPAKRSVVLLKAVRSQNHSSKSAWAQLQRVLGAAADSLDGQTLDGSANSLVELAQKKSDEHILRVTITTRELLEASSKRKRITDVIIPTR